MPLVLNYTLYLPEQRTHRPITSQYPLETIICTHSVHKQCAIGMFFLTLLLWQLLLKLLKIWFLNRSYSGTPPSRWRESRPYLEEPRLNLFYPTLSLCTCSSVLHCLPTVTLTSLPALSLQHTEVELYFGRRREKKLIPGKWYFVDRSNGTSVRRGHKIPTCFGCRGVLEFSLGRCMSNADMGENDGDILW